MLLAVVNTLRTILVLLVIWWLLRMFMRRGQQGGSQGPGPGRSRKRGEVTLERTDQGNRSQTGNDDIIDAEYEEVH